MGPAIPSTPEEGRVRPVGRAAQESCGAAHIIPRRELRLRWTDGVEKLVPEGCDGEGCGWNLSRVGRSEHGGDVSKRAPRVSFKSMPRYLGVGSQQPEIL